jgi:hypothetical protein
MIKYMEKFYFVKGIRWEKVEMEISNMVTD